MSDDERETPLTDAESKRLEVQAIGWDAFEDMADHARQLERMCQELAEACNGLLDKIQYNDICNCSVCKGMKVISEALSNWKKLQEGKESK